MTSSRTTSRPTLEQVAALAGVSRGTASRVLSGASNVSDSAVEAVRRAAAFPVDTHFKAVCQWAFHQFTPPSQQIKAMPDQSSTDALSLKFW